MEKIELHDLVALLEPINEYGLSKGQVGTIVDILEPGKVYLVEFANRSGETLCLAPLTAEKILHIYFHAELAV